MELVNGACWETDWRDDMWDIRQPRPSDMRWRNSDGGILKMLNELNTVLLTAEAMKSLFKEQGRAQMRRKMLHMPKAAVIVQRGRGRHGSCGKIAES
jgi:hypothetical protein